jgi:hypothetical protein
MARLLVAALYLALAAVYLQVEVLHTAQSPTSASVGDPVSNSYPMLRYGFGQLRAGSLPLWTATIDGQPAAIHRADCLFGGVLLPTGSHRVEFVYWPASFRIGATVSALALVAIVLLAVAGRARYPLSRFETVNTPSGTPAS